MFYAAVSDTKTKFHEKNCIICISCFKHTRFPSSRVLSVIDPTFYIFLSFVTLKNLNTFLIKKSILKKILNYHISINKHCPKKLQILS